MLFSYPHAVAYLVLGAAGRWLAGSDLVLEHLRLLLAQLVAAAPASVSTATIWRRRAFGVGSAVCASRLKQLRQMQRPITIGVIASSSSTSKRQITQVYIVLSFASGSGGEVAWLTNPGRGLE